MSKALLSLALLVPLAAASPPSADPLAGRVAGTPRQCITLRPSLGSSIADGHIIYKPSRSTWYVNTPDCPALKGRMNVAISTVTPTTSLCRGDIVRVFDPRSPIVYGSCGLGEFIPYTRTAK